MYNVRNSIPSANSHGTHTQHTYTICLPIKTFDTVFIKIHNKMTKSLYTFYKITIQIWPLLSSTNRFNKNYRKHIKRLNLNVKLSEHKQYIQLTLLAEIVNNGAQVPITISLTHIYALWPVRKVNKHCTVCIIYMTEWFVTYKLKTSKWCAQACFGRSSISINPVFTYTKSLEPKNNVYAT